MRFIDFLNESNHKTKQLRRLSITESEYTVQPKSKYELVRIIKDYCEKNGWNSDLNFIDTSLITDMSDLFCDLENFGQGYGLEKFNGDISKWDVSNVKYMSYMFGAAESFNQPLDKWDVSNVKDMHGMFCGAYNFNQPLNNWDVSKVKNMSLMFSNAVRFNQPLNNWDVSNVEDMSWMFFGARSFNQPLNNWDVSSVDKMECMFTDALDFDQPLDKWDVSNVIDMFDEGGMFRGSKLGTSSNFPEWGFE